MQWSHWGCNETSTELPYVTSEIEGLGGRIRAIPLHFIVEELPLYEPIGKGRHLYVNLTRENLTTPEIQERLARLSGTQSSDVGFAGLKDKHARTTQTFSIPVASTDCHAIENLTAQIQKELPAVVNWSRLHSNKLRIGHLAGNRFTIIITEIETADEETFRRAEQVAIILRNRGLPNYFGPQRFGYHGQNVRRGREILLGRLSLADRWLRRYLINSYQSHLCNRSLGLRLTLGLFERVLVGDIARKYTTRSFFEVRDHEAEQTRYDSHEISFTAPIYGYEMPMATGIVGELESKVLAESGLTLDTFEHAKVKGSRRIGRLLPLDLTMKTSTRSLILSFSLPKGGFATTVLREFMKNEELGTDFVQ